MLKIVIVTVVVTLAGCASQAQSKYYPADMTNFIASCQQAKTQMDFLSQKINEYDEYHRTNPPTLEDRRYYSNLKNNLWSLRSSCPQKFL
jgi:uncharacterized lipoprotein YmbA